MVTADKTTKSKKVRADTARINDQPAGRGVKLDSVEKTLLGITLGDGVEFTARSVTPLPKFQAARLANIRSFLTEQPRLRKVLTQEVEKAWQDSNGKRGEFLKTIAERRAQILSQAELAYWRKQAPQAIAQFHDELSRFLNNM